MKIIENTIAYKCEFCGRTSLNRGNMVSHERACKRNPRNHATCLNCANFDCNYNDDERVKVTGWFDTGYGMAKEERLWYPHKCKCDGKMLFNRFHMNKDWVETLEEEGWRPMPNMLDGCPNRKAWSLDDILLEDIF